MPDIPVIVISGTVTTRFERSRDRRSLLPTKRLSPRSRREAH